MASRRVYHFETMRPARLLLGLAGFFVVAAVFVVPALGSRGISGAFWAAVVIVATVVAVFAAVRTSPDAGLAFEYDLRRKFRAVCRERGLVGKGMDGKVVYPGLSQLIGGLEAVVLKIRPLHGQSLADWEKAGAAFGLALAVYGVRFSENGDGTLMMRAGYQPMDSNDVQLADEVVANPGPSTWRDLLAVVPVGTREGGGRYFLPFLDSHILVAGMTGAGKGSVIWSVVLGLRSAWHAGVVRFWGLDPKLMELAIGRQFFGDRYANRQEAMVQLLERAAKEMLDRADALGGKTRRFEPSPDCPVNVIIVDELGYLASLMTDRKLEHRAEVALKTILGLGRSVGYVVVGAVQDPRKSTLEFRDLFPTRVAMKLDKPMVDLVLGTGMHAAGAVCDQIPPPKSGGAGVAFVKEESGAPICVRFSWCSDEVISRVAGELEPPAAVPQIG